jgi:hypothetical protein
MDKIDLGRAFKAPFADTDWVKKTLMGWLWMLLGVTAPAVYGAQLEYIKSVSEGREELPDWSDFGGKWVKGFLLLIAGFIYFLPVIVLGFIFAIPVIIAAASGSNGMGGLAAGGMCLFWLFALVYTIAVAIIFYAATVNYALKGTFGSFFQFSEILARVRDGSGYFNAWLWAIVVSFAAGLAVSILSATFIGYILVPAVSYLSVMITAHLFGQWATRSYGIQAAAAPVGVPGYVPPAGAYAPPAYAPPAAPAAPTPPAAPVSPPAPYQPPVAPPAAPVAPEPPIAPPAAPVAPEAPVAPPAAPTAPPAPYEPPTAPPAPPGGPDVPIS